MKTSRVILDERSGRWAVALSRPLPAGVQLLQTRGRDECDKALADATTSLVALELTTENAADVVELTSKIVHRYAWAGVVILVGEDAADCVQLLREAGATHVFHSPRELDGWRQTVERHFGRVPLEPGEFAAAVWDSLPWKSAAKA